MALILLPGLTVAGWGQSIYGIWLTDDGRGAVQIAPCGSAACGRVTWTQDARARDGGPLVDRLNPNPALRSRAICGLQVLGGLKRQTGGMWGQGWVYDPKTGRSYNVELSLKDSGTLAVHGYLQTKTLGRTQYWTRARGRLARC